MVAELRRILVADDHALFRSGLSLLLRRLFDHVEVVEARDASTALTALCEEDSFDLVLLDLAMPGMASWDGLDAVLGQAGETPVAILSAHQDPAAIRTCIEAGARGYLLKSLTEGNLHHAIALIMEGEVYVPSVALQHGGLPHGGLQHGGLQNGVSGPIQDAQAREGAKSLGPDNPLARLTKRQYEVAMLMALGDSNKVIARKLGVYESTVKAHVQVILQKLAATNRTHAAMILREWSEKAPPPEDTALLS